MTILPCCKTAILVDLWVEAEAASGLFHLDAVKYLKQTEMSIKAKQSIVKILVPEAINNDE